MDDAHKELLKLAAYSSYRHTIGSIITSWAAFEARLASAIWRIGEMRDEIGASLTSQIYTLDGKVKALQAILRVKGFEKEAKKIGKLINDAKGLSDLRNRVVHDPIIYMEGAVHRLLIKADRYVELEYIKVEIDELEKAVDKIADIDDKMDDILRPVLEKIPRLSLRDKSDASPPHG